MRYEIEKGLRAVSGITLKVSNMTWAKVTSLKTPVFICTCWIEELEWDICTKWRELHGCRAGSTSSYLPWPPGERELLETPIQK